VPTVHIYPCVPSPGRSDPPTPSTGKARDVPTNFPLCNCFPRARMVKRWHHPTLPCSSLLCVGEGVVDRAPSGCGMCARLCSLAPTPPHPHPPQGLRRPSSAPPGGGDTLDYSPTFRTPPLENHFGESGGRRTSTGDYYPGRENPHGFVPLGPPRWGGTGYSGQGQTHQGQGGPSQPTGPASVARIMPHEMQWGPVSETDSYRGDVTPLPTRRRSSAASDRPASDRGWYCLPAFLLWYHVPLQPVGQPQPRPPLPNMFIPPRSLSSRLHSCSTNLANPSWREVGKLS
jgi:hypothetical protein